MKVYMLWHGGSSYSVGGYDDIESFDSLGIARDEFELRTRSHMTFYPCVSTDTPDNGGPSAWIFLYSKPDDNGDLYPDRVMEFGPRGGIQISRA